jgi:translation initiation factor IF-3
MSDKFVARILADTLDVGKIDKDPHMLGRNLILILCPK